MPRLLIIDDTPGFREPIAAALSYYGYQVTAAGNGEEAIARLEEHRPDLILADIAMPVLDGISFLQAVRGDPRWAAIPVVLLTAHARPDYLAQGKALGITQYLLKAQFSLDELLGVLRQTLGVSAPPAPPPPPSPSNSPSPPPATSLTPASTSAFASPSVSPPLSSSAASSFPHHPSIAASPSFVPTPPAAFAASDLPTSPSGSKLRAESVSPAMRRQQTLQRLEQSAELHALSGVAAQVVAMATSPRATLGDLVDVLKKDAVLAARVLQVANSAAFATHKARITTVEEAVRNVGMSAVRNLAVSAGVIGAFNTAPEEGLPILRCWQHSLAVASLMDQLLSGADPSVRSIAYLVGLCHDLGELVLQQCFAEELAQLMAASAEPASQIERQVLGLSRAELAKAVLEKLGLPMEIAAPIQAFWSAGTPAHGAALLQALRIANTYAHGLGLTSDAEALLAPVTKAELKNATGTPQSPSVAPQLLRNEVVLTTHLLARPSARQAEAIQKPVLPELPHCLYYVRHPVFSEFDPVLAGLGWLVRQVDGYDELPSRPEQMQGYDALVVVTPKPTLPPVAIDQIRGVQRLLAAQPLSVVCLTAAGATVEPDSPAEITLESYPVSLRRLHETLAATGPEAAARRRVQTAGV